MEQIKLFERNGDSGLIDRFEETINMFLSEHEAKIIYVDSQRIYFSYMEHEKSSKGLDEISKDMIKINNGEMVIRVS